MVVAKWEEESKMRDQIGQITLRGSLGSPYTYRHSSEKIFPLVARNTMLAIFFLLLLIIGAFYSISLPESFVFNSISGFSPKKSSVLNSTTTMDNKTRPGDNVVKSLNSTDKVEFPLNCSLGDNMRTCPANYYPSKFSAEESPNPSLTPQRTCPDYFRYIHEDLWPWRETGITENMVSMASKTANFRLVIVNGRAYVETYEKAFQTRDTFTLWGILQLLRKYPGQIPDLELMFDCVDWPVVRKEDYDHHNASTPPGPPPLFRYCADDATYDIVFPDWSFWGWAEINIKPWEHLSKDLKEGNKRSRWVDREPYAYWKGNPQVAENRLDLVKCNVSDTQDWNARIFIQDWVREHQEGYKQSNLAKQCNHRYKIYIEGSAWSVSEKYILACDSVPLIINPRYYDFFSRGLMPLQHYWPVNADDKCRSIKYAVDWGNSNVEKAQAIAKAASRFILDELKMDNVYDYMFHLLSEYAKLLKYKPSVPPNAVELCSESMACPAQGFEKKFMMDSTVKAPRSESPCVMPPPRDPATLHSIIERREGSIKQAETWKNQYWDSKSKHV